MKSINLFGQWNRSCLHSLLTRKEQKTWYQTMLANNVSNDSMLPVWSLLIFWDSKYWLHSAFLSCASTSFLLVNFKNCQCACFCLFSFDHWEINRTKRYCDDDRRCHKAFRDPEEKCRSPENSLESFYQPKSECTNLKRRRESEFITKWNCYVKISYRRYDFFSSAFRCIHSSAFLRFFLPKKRNWNFLSRN